MHWYAFATEQAPHHGPKCKCISFLQTTNPEEPSLEPDEDGQNGEDDEEQGDDFQGNAMVRGRDRTMSWPLGRHPRKLKLAG